MNSQYYMNYNANMSEGIQSMTIDTHYYGYPSLNLTPKCTVCGSKPIGMNFGVLSCAPCKAFFRRNAKRRELLEFPCRHRGLNKCKINNMDLNERYIRYFHIRRCSSCRLRRCFEVGMKEELIRTNEQNEQYKQLVEMNKRRREFLKQQLLEIEQISIPQYIFNDSQLLDEIDWRHLSNIVYAYDMCCLKTYIHQRATMIFNRNLSTSDEQLTNKRPTSLTMSLVLAISSFLKSLPAYYSLPHATRNYLCETNIRPLIFPNVHELSQSCFSEPWQVDAVSDTWKFMCGVELYKDFTQAEQLAQKLWITDPLVTRLWVIILFFSSPLHYHHEDPIPTPILKKKSPVYKVQNAYVTLLWKYLLHRYGDMEAIRIYSNLIHVYLKMQCVGFGIYIRLRTQQDLMSTDETLSRLVSLDTNATEYEREDI